MGGPFDFWGGGGGGGGGEDSDCARIFFPPIGTKQIIFSCKSAAQDIFFPIYLAAGYFFASHNNGLQ
jgi:hypothetical protein